MILIALFKLAFASAPILYILTSHHIVTRRPVLQKVRYHTLNSAISACKHTVSGSFSLPSRGSFHLSLTVLFAIGHMVVFSLMRWASYLPSRFLVSRRTPDTAKLFDNVGYRSVTSYGPAFQPCSPIISDAFVAVLTPKVLLPLVWAAPISLATTFGIVFTFFYSG